MTRAHLEAAALCQMVRDRISQLDREIADLRRETDKRPDPWRIQTLIQLRGGREELVKLLATMEQEMP